MAKKRVVDIEITEEELQRQYDECLEESVKLDKKMSEIRSKLYTAKYDVWLKPYIGHWVKLNGMSSMDETEKPARAYRIFHIDGAKDYVGGNSVYFKISNLVLFVSDKESGEYDVRFGDYAADSYRVNDFTCLKILTDAQAVKEIEKIQSFVSKQFDKATKSLRGK